MTDQEFTAEFDKMRAWADRSLYRILPNRQDREDAIQTGLLRCWEFRAGWDRRAAFTSWAYRVVMNSAFDMIRRRKRTRYDQHVSLSNFFEEYLVAPGMTVESSLIETETLQIVRGLMRDRERAVFEDGSGGSPIVRLRRVRAKKRIVEAYRRLEKREAA